MIAITLALVIRIKFHKKSHTASINFWRVYDMHIILYKTSFAILSCKVRELFTVDTYTLSLCRYCTLWILVHCHWADVTVDMLVDCLCFSVTVDTCTLSLCWCHVVPHGDCSHHPNTHQGDILSLVVMKV